MILGAGLVPALFSEKEMQMESRWYLYILKCKDGTLYTGITTDVEKRLEAHRSGRGAKYTRGRAPLELVYRETCGSHSYALKREHQINKNSSKTRGILVIVAEISKLLDKAVSLCYLIYRN